MIFHLISHMLSAKGNKTVNQHFLFSEQLWLSYPGACLYLQFWLFPPLQHTVLSLGDGLHLVFIFSFTNGNAVVVLPRSGSKLQYYLCYLSCPRSPSTRFFFSRRHPTLVTINLLQLTMEKKDEQYTCNPCHRSLVYDNLMIYPEVGGLITRTRCCAVFLCLRVNALGSAERGSQNRTPSCTEESRFQCCCKTDLEGLREIFRGVMVLGCKCRALGMLGKPSTTESHLQSNGWYSIEYINTR